MSDDEDEVCASCNKQCHFHEGLTCDGCNDSYHFGKCSGVAASTFKSKGKPWKKAWRCSTCKSSGTSASQSPKSKTEQDLLCMFNTLNGKLDDLMELKSTVQKIESSVDMMSSQYDKILEHMHKQDKELAQLKKRMHAVESQQQTLETGKIRQDLDELEWQSRKLNLEFHGIPFTDDEDPLSKVNAVAAKMQVPALAASDVVSIHRLPTSRDRVPAIIVRFANQSIKDAFLEKRNELKKMKDQCFILENLTKKNKALLAATKEWARNNGFKYAWHRNGKIFLRQKDGERAVMVRKEDDLGSLE